MKNVLLFLVFIIPVLGIVAGLSVGVIVPLFFVMSLESLQDMEKMNIKNYKLEAAFFTYLSLSSLWSLNSSASLNSAFNVLIFFGSAALLIISVHKFSAIIKLSHNFFFVTILICIVIFWLEYLSHGFFNIFFRKIFEVKKPIEFFLHYLDRGCALLALFAWVVIASLLKAQKYKLSFVTYLLVLITLFVSDSLASFCGFALSGIVYLVAKVLSDKVGNNLAKIISALLILASLSFIVSVFLINPYKFAEDKGQFLPFSAKHRLFIWNYSANKIIQKPFLGWGHNSSKQFKIPENEMIDYNGISISPLPMHPHNNLLQILLEIGIIGLIAYLALIVKYLFLWSNLAHSSSNIKAAGYAWFACFFIISMISFNMWQGWWLCTYLWTGFMLCYAATYKGKSYDNTKTS